MMRHILKRLSTPRDRPVTRQRLCRRVLDELRGISASFSVAAKRSSMDLFLSMTTAFRRAPQNFTLNVNGKTHEVEADPDMPLLYALRNDVGLKNPRFGCGLAQCGACTVHIDGQAIRSCITPVSSVGSAKVVTLEGLGTPEKPHPLQTAYVEEQVPQCGYCINGWIMTAASFLATKKKPTEAEIKSALEGVKCRCGTHVSIMKAVKRAAAMMG